MTFLSYAQNFEDVLLWRALGSIGHGFYIDVGAYHPDIDSVTRAFYDRGWSGVNIEPLEQEAQRLTAARPRDVTLQIALGTERGEAPFYRIAGSGLSTLDPKIAAKHQAAGLDVTAGLIATLTLAEVCALYAPAEVHFLKIDVEGAERAVLEGADLVRFRPWIILVEATAPNSTDQTHEAWEPLLDEADYRFIWFDGLNRYYVADERHAQLEPAFRTPPNVFDDFVRASDSVWIDRAGRLGLEVAVGRERVRLAEVQVQEAAERERLQREVSRHESGRLRETLGRLQSDTRRMLHENRHELQLTHLQLQKALREREIALLELDAVHRSTSWKLTGPVRVAVRQTRRLVGRGDQSTTAPQPSLQAEPVLPAVGVEFVAGQDHEPATEPDPIPLPPLPITPPPAFLTSSGLRSDGLTTVHQFHDGSAVHDAITNAMLFTRGLLRAMGYRSEIYSGAPPAPLAGELLPIEALPRHEDYVLIVRHSMGYDRFDQILTLPAPKILLYHNITPPELLARHPYFARYAKLGREQLAGFKGRVSGALADSEYNANELRGLGIAPVRACTLLFDPDVLRHRAATATGRLRERGCFTIIFVGRINESKGQLDLLEAFKVFSIQFARPARLILIGRADAADDPYARSVSHAIEQHGLISHVVQTGSVSDDVLHEWYAAADLYVSLSRHEGFGVPLVEAMAHGVPVLAYPGGAVPYTLGGPAGLLFDRAPAAVAQAILRLACDAEARAALALEQAATLVRFDLDRQRDMLAQALLRAGAALPIDPTTRSLLQANLRFSIVGHVNGSYSLAAINRDLARALDAALPGRIRLLPVEGAPTLDVSGVPVDELPHLSELVHRPRHPTGPEMVISQHYPVHVPKHRGDVMVAMLFWEESLLPAATIDLLNREFDAVVAPTRFVRDALVESGLAIPVRVIPPAVQLERFAALRTQKQATSPIHRFLHVSSCFPRKGVDVLLRAWAQAFRAGDPVRLVIKGFPNPHNDVAEQLAMLQAADPDLAPVELIDRDMNGEALLDLYRDADTMVLPTRGEGYNLPAAEALAAGLALIVTGRGGHMDFSVGPDGPLPGVRLLRYSRVPSASHVAVTDSLWLEPKLDDLVAALRERCAEQPAGSRVQTLPLRLPDADVLADAYSALARDLLLRAPPRLPRITWVSTWGVRCGVAEYSRQLLDSLLNPAAGEQKLRIRILCDRRTFADASEEVDPTLAEEVWPCWEVLDPRSVEPLALAIAADDAPAIVLQHQPGLLSFGSLARLIDHRALRGRIIVVALHNSNHLLGLPAEEQGAAVDALRRIDRILVHTVADLVRLQSLGLDANTMLLPHGIARAMTPPSLRKLETGGAPTIGCYGFFLPHKGIATLIEAFAILRRRWPRARLRLVNAEYDHPDSPLEIARCRSLADDLGVSSAITFETGFLPHRRSLELLGECDLIALPYQPSNEAASGAMRTALTSGVPVAVTPVSLFDDAGNAVFRFDGNDAGAVAEGIAMLLADHAGRVALQRQAQDWIAARQWPDLASRLAGMLTGLIRTREIEQATK